MCEGPPKKIPNNNSQSSENNQFLEEESVIMSNDIFRKRPILGKRVLVPMNRDNMDSKADVYVAEHGTTDYFYPAS